MTIESSVNIPLPVSKLMKLCNNPEATIKLKKNIPNVYSFLFIDLGFAWFDCLRRMYKDLRFLFYTSKMPTVNVIKLPSAKMRAICAFTQI
jgi:hypothetical protein